MSRSYKKYAGNVDRNPYMKNYANRKLRGIKGDVTLFGKGTEYKRLTCSWDICDWKFIYHSNEEIIRIANNEYDYYSTVDRKKSQIGTREQFVKKFKHELLMK